MSKYRSRKVDVDGFSFDSQAEATRYAELQLLERSEEITDLRVHPSWILQPRFLKPDGRIVRPITYEADFAYIENDHLVVEDVKPAWKDPRKDGAWQVFRLKAKLLLYTHGIDVRVVDKAGTPVPPGIPGEVVTRGPHLISGYWNRPDATQEAIREGWFHTGDIAEVDAEGFIYIKDRSKDMVITGGENVYPAEVEDVLGGHAGVREVGVIGQPSPRWGESVCAVIVRGDDWKGDDELLVQELRTLVQSRLARFKQPKSYVFMSALPRNPSGKILKRMLREQFPGPASE